MKYELKRLFEKEPHQINIWDNLDQSIRKIALAQFGTIEAILKVDYEVVKNVKLDESCLPKPPPENDLAHVVADEEA